MPRAKTRQIPPLTAFAKFLQAYMDRRGWTNADLARALTALAPSDPVSDGTVGQWFNNATQPSFRYCRLVSLLTGEPLDSVLRLSGHLEEGDALPLPAPAVPGWLTQELVDLDEYERGIIAQTAQTLRSLRERRAEYGAERPPTPAG